MQTTRIQKYYNNVIVEDLILILNCQNIMELPEMSRIILSTSSKSFGAEKQEIINAFAIYFLLSGQKGVSTRARNSIAAFGVRKDSIIGCLVTLRKERLYALFDKIINFVLPRERIQMNANKLLSIKFCDSKKSIQSRTFVAPLSVRDSRLPSFFALDEDLSFSSSSGSSKALDQFRDQGEWSRKKTREFHFGISQSKSFPEIENMFERFGSSLGLNISFSIKTSKLQNMFWLKAGMLAEHSSACGAMQAFTYANASDAFALPKQSKSMHLEALHSVAMHASQCVTRTQTENKHSLCKPMHSYAMQAKLGSAERDISQKYNSNFTIFSKSVLKKDIPKIYDKDLLFLSAFQFPCT